jgi:hypothetical protein
VKNYARPWFALATFVLVYGAVPMRGSVAPDPALNSPDHVRAELRAYFKDIGKNAPTAFGGLANNPTALKAVDERIATMNDAELAHFQQMMKEAPDWKQVPEAIAKSFPPEMVEQIRKLGADYTARIPKGEGMRDDVQLLVRVLRQAPDAKLKEMGIDRKMLDSLEGTFNGMSPLQLAMLQRQAAEGTTWRENSALAMQNLPLAFQHGAAALAKHGPLTEKDVKELTAFRARLLRVFTHLEALPPDARSKLNAEGITEQARMIHDASNDTLFMLRENISPEQLKTLESNIAMVERLSTFTDDEKRDLEKFRSDFGKTLKPLEVAGGKSLDDVVSKMGPAELYVAKQRLDAMGAWQIALPATYQVLASPETAPRLKALQMPAPDPKATMELEMFRKQALAYIDANATAPGIEARLAVRARTAVEHARLDRLELLRLTVQKMPDGASAEAMFTIAAMSADFEIGNCALKIIDAFCVNLDPTGLCGDDCEVCTPDVTLDVNFICNPIEDAMQSIKDGAVSTANTLIAGMQTAINSAINGLKSTINGLVSSVQNIIDTAVSAITGVVNDIYAFVQTIPDKAYGVLKAALDALLDIQIKNGITLRQLLAQGVEVSLNSMKTLVGLSGDWWTAVSTFTLPAIPCPPAGFHTLFGDVGTGEASKNFKRYNVLVSAIGDMIPDTELSLPYKIPAQLLFASFEFLGVCLEQASAQADDNLAESRHGIVLQNFANLQTFVTAQFGILATNSSNDALALTGAVNTLNTNVSNTTNTQFNAINTKLTNETNTIQSLTNTRFDTLEALAKNLGNDTRTNLTSFKTSWLRLWVEMVLASDGEQSLLGTFELHDPIGDLSIVKDVVRTTLDNMIAANEKVGGSAQQKYDKAVQLMNAGQDKDAYKQFVQAYQEATK